MDTNLLFMSNKRIEMVNIKHLLRLKLEGHSNRSIGKQLAVNRKTIDKYVQFFNQRQESYEELLGMGEAELFALFPEKTNKATGKYEVLSKQFSYYERELKRPGATYLGLWQEYRQSHPQGYSYNQFKNHLQQWISRQKVGMRIEHKFGDKLFVDYCGKKLHLTDRETGTQTPVEVLVGILGGSQYIYVEATLTQQLDDFLNGMINMLEYYDGVPKAIVPDNLKSAVTKPSRYEPNINRNFASFGVHYQTTILPTRSGKPKDKPLVESAVRLVYQHIYFPLRNVTFFSLPDLNQAIRQQLTKLNKKSFYNKNYSRQDLFEQEEKPLLGPLPKERFERKIYREGKVNQDTHVWFGEDKHYYSAPSQYIGKRVQIRANATTIELYYNYKRIALHQRSDKVGGFTTNDKHLPANIRFVKNWSMDQFTDKANQIGPLTYEFFCKVFEHKPHPEQAYKACMGLLKLARHFGNARMEKACYRADFYGAYTYQAVKVILEQGIEEWELGEPAPEEQQDIINESHPNIRGGDYFK